MAGRPDPNSPEYLPGPHDSQEVRTKKADAYAKALLAWNENTGRVGSRSSKTLETTKFVLDMAGVVDPTGIADLTSAGISLGQGVSKMAKGEEGAGQHFIDAAISGVSALPFGDIAKLGKLRKGKKAATGGAKAATGGAKAASKAPVDSAKGALKGAWEAIQSSFGFDKTAAKLADSEAAMKAAAHRAALAQGAAETPKELKRAKELKREASKAYKSYDAAKAEHAASTSARPKSVSYASEELKGMKPGPKEGLGGFAKRAGRDFVENTISHKLGETILGPDASPEILQKSVEVTKPFVHAGMNSAGDWFKNRGGGGSGGGGFPGMPGFPGGKLPGMPHIPDPGGLRRKSAELRQRGMNAIRGAAGFAMGAAGVDPNGPGIQGHGGALSNTVEGKIFSDVASSFKKLLDPSTSLSEKFKELAKTVVTLPKALVDWSSALLDSQKRLRDVSGPQAQIFAERDIRQIRRDILSGQATAGSTGQLSEALDDLLDELRPIKDDIRNFIQSTLVPFITTMTEFVQFTKEYINAGGPLAGKSAIDAASRAVDLNKRLEELRERREGEVGMRMFADFLTEVKPPPPPSGRPGRGGTPRI
jgi:hypothetical protein